MAAGEKALALEDEDYSLSLRYASPDDAARLSAVFAIQTELRRIPHAVSEPPLGEIRLQWWREALDAVVGGRTARNHPAVELLAASGGLTPDDRARFEQLIDARARLLYETRFSSEADLRDFLRGAEAPIAALALGKGENLSADAALRLGEAYGLARFAPLIAPPLAIEAAATALRLHAGIANMAVLSPRDTGRVAFLALTRGYAARADARAWPVGKRLSLFKRVLSGRF